METAGNLCVMSDPRATLEHLFRHESGKLVAALTRIFGTHNLELAEDVVQETLIKALDNWKFHGVPANPSGWLFTVARNHALDVLRRERHQKEFSAEFGALLKSEYSAGVTLKNNLSGHTIEDEQLRMMFVCCHPSIQEEAQVAMILKTLCGFSSAEIAHAFLTNEETITKRLYRARQQFREQRIAFSIPTADEIPERCENVLTAIYLIFNEGYHTSYHPDAIREDLVEEAIRLGNLLLSNPLTRQPDVYALLALMCFQAARLYERVDKDGMLLHLRHQNRSKWNRALIDQGIYFLELASTGEQISAYHLEAGIAHEHCIAPDYNHTNWAHIIQLYDWLVQIKPDGLVGLNRLIAVAELYGPEKALEEFNKLPLDSLRGNSLVPAVLAEWHMQLGNHQLSRKHLKDAINLTGSPSEKKFLEQKLKSLN